MIEIFLTVAIAFYTVLIFAGLIISSIFPEYTPQHKIASEIPYAAMWAMAITIVSVVILKGAFI